MQYTLKDKIFNFFGVNAKVNDSYKDVNKKGINERYQESLGSDYDDNVSNLIDNLHDNTLNPRTFLYKFINLIEYNFGNPFIVIDTPARRRKMIEFSNSFYRIKGTFLSHQVLYNMLGFNVDDIVNVERESGFDSVSFTLDDVRRFDSSALCCRHYVIELSGGVVVSDELYDLVFAIAEYLRPIDAELDGINYNGSPIVPVDYRIFDDTFEIEFE